MLSSQITFAVVAAITISSGVGAAMLVAFGDASSAAGRRAVAMRLAQIAVVGATAMSALLHAG